LIDVVADLVERFPNREGRVARVDCQETSVQFHLSGDGGRAIAVGVVTVESHLNGIGVFHGGTMGHKGVSESICEATFTRVDKAGNELSAVLIAVDVLVEFSAKDKTALVRACIFTGARVAFVDTFSKRVIH